MAPKKKERKIVEMAAIQDKNESIKKCVICLDVVTVRGKIPVCDHQFCYTCIHEWSKTTNTCPLCKKRFRCISKISEASPPRLIRISDKDQTEHYQEEGVDFNAFNFSDDSEYDEPDDSLADFIVNDSSFDEEDESIMSSFASPPTVRRGWQQRLNLRITSTVNTRTRRNGVRDVPSIEVLFSPPVTRNRSRGTQLLLDFETISSSSPLSSSSREQDSISPIITRGRSRTNNRVLSSSESSSSPRDSSPNITEPESNIVDSSSDSNISKVSSSPGSPSGSHSSITSSTFDATNSDNTDSNLPLRNPSLSLRRNPAIRLPLRGLRPVHPVIERIKLRESDNGTRSTESSSSGVVSLISEGTSTPSSPSSSPHSSVSVIKESPVENEGEEEEEEEKESDEDATQSLSSPISSQEVKTSKKRSVCATLPLCPLSNSMSFSPVNSQAFIIKRRAKSRIINDSTSEDESIEEVPNRKRTRRQIKSSPMWLSSRTQRGAISSNMRRTRMRGNRRRTQASDSGSDYNPFDF